MELNLENIIKLTEQIINHYWEMIKYWKGKGRDDLAEKCRGYMSGMIRIKWLMTDPEFFADIVKIFMEDNKNDNDDK